MKRPAWIVGCLAVLAALAVISVGLATSSRNVVAQPPFAPGAKPGGGPGEPSTPLAKELAPIGTLQDEETWAAVELTRIMAEFGLTKEEVSDIYLHMVNIVVSERLRRVTLSNERLRSSIEDYLSATVGEPKRRDAAAPVDQTGLRP